jgi:hypothetical protein
MWAAVSMRSRTTVTLNETNRREAEKTPYSGMSLASAPDPLIEDSDLDSYFLAKKGDPL